MRHYRILKIAHSSSGSDLSPLQWLEERSTVSQMCFYWKLILNFQINILVFVRAIREGNFKLYFETLFLLLKWYFIVDKY